MRGFVERHLNVALALILFLSITRLWIISLGGSFWVDEMVTAFVVHHGANHPSLAIAPQVAKSIYYPVASVADSLFGVSEAGYRLPSVLMLGLALIFVAKLAAAMIHPDAGWFAVFACLGLKAINTEATDARPYAMGILVSAAALWFLVRWLDSNRWVPAAGFLVAAALLWRVHLLFWPVYVLFAFYAILRFALRQTDVPWWKIAGIFLGAGITLIPVLIGAMPILREAHSHVIMPPPTWGELTDALKWKLLLAAFAIAGILDRMLQWNPEQTPSTWRKMTGSSIGLILGWWLIHPLTLFIFSRVSGDSVFVPRYLAVTLPGTAMAATLGAALFLPRSDGRHWRFAALALGAGVLLTVGNWRHPWTEYAHSDWRGAAAAVRSIAGPETPVICPSPFIEARSPVWNPNYALPGFLYSYLTVYATGGHQYLFPYEDSPEADRYGHDLAPLLARSGGFIVYGGRGPAAYWRDWFEKQPELIGWKARPLGSFGDVEAIVVQPGR